MAPMQPLGGNCVAWNGTCDGLAWGWVFMTGFNWEERVGSAWNTYLFVCLPIYLSIYLPIYLSIYLVIGRGMASHCGFGGTLFLDKSLQFDVKKKI